MFFFFFQAEDGIRDYKVTGVQTCALPILREPEIQIGNSANECGKEYRLRHVPNALMEGSTQTHEKNTETHLRPSCFCAYVPSGSGCRRSIISRDDLIKSA